MLRHLVVLALLAASAGAQLTDKEAVKQFKGDAKQVVKDTKAEIKVATSDALAAIKALNSAAKQEGFLLTEIDGLYDDLDTCLCTMTDVISGAQSDLAIAGFNALAALAGPEDLGGIYPEALYEDSKSIGTKAKADIDKAVARSIRKLSGALRKTESILEKSANVGFRHFLAPPEPYYDIVWNDLNTHVEFGLSWTVDILFAYSSLAVQGDGKILAGGTAVGPGTDPTVRANGAPAPVNIDAVYDLPRWSGTFEGMREGNYSIEYYDLDMSQTHGPNGVIGLR